MSDLLTRRHFWESVALCVLGVTLPRKMSLNWFIPALVNISVGSFFTTIGAEGTIMCPLDAKKSRNFCLISFDVIIMTINFFVKTTFRHKISCAIRPKTK